MIAYLKGMIFTMNPAEVIVESQGVGYSVEVPLSTYYELGGPGSEVELLIHTHVREDSLQLFGFSTSGERLLFRRLINVSGIGPKLALAIIGGMGPAEFLGALDNADVARIVAIPGVGKKTAERLVLELRDKLIELQTELEVEPEEIVGTKATLRRDIISALENLGFKKNVAERAVKNASEQLGSDTDFERILKKSLTILTGNR
jgi:Holliday junction DNA helicase RuvA